MTFPSPSTRNAAPDSPGRNRAKLSAMRGSVGGLVLGGERSLQPREPDRVPHRVGTSIEETDDVGAAGLLVDQQQRLLPRFGVELAQAQGGRGERERVELVHQRAVDFGRERPRILGVDLVELAPQRLAPSRKRERGGQEQRKAAGRREEKRQLDRKSHQAP